MAEQTITQTCADIDDLHRQIAALTADNGNLRAQHHDLARAKEAACEDARTLRRELETVNNELHTARVRANAPTQRGW